MKMHRVLWILLLIATFPSNAQHYVLDSVLSIHPNLVNKEVNNFQFADSSRYFQRFFLSLDSVYAGHKRKVHIFHIGGSHIQADIYPNRLRTYLQSSSEYTMSQRGFVFPFKLANTNNPANYRITSDAKWMGKRSSLKKDSIAWGLAGITAIFDEEVDTVSVEANHKSYNKKPYYFNKFRLFYNTWNESYQVTPVDTSLVDSIFIDRETNYVEYFFKENQQTFDFEVRRVDSLAAEPFLLMGMELMNDEPGVEYTSIGVNGADFPSYARSAFFEKQLQLYKPDMFIISIGTNDTYMPAAAFDPEKFRSDYEAFLQLIQRVNPDCAILLTVPNDSYYKRKVANPNTAKAEAVIVELAQKYHMAVWNFYQVMGGYRSSQKWYQNHFMPRDRIHFTQKGYHIKSDLLMEAFVTEWEKATGREPGSLLKVIRENADE